MLGGISSLSDRISDSDRSQVSTLLNPPEFEPGFEGGGSSVSNDFDDLFGSDSSGSFDDLFGSDSSSSFDDIFGGSSSSEFSGRSSFGNPGFGDAISNSSFGNDKPNQNNQNNKSPDLMDKVIDGSIEATESFGKIIVELFKSIRNRNADDLGYLSRNLIMTGLGCGVCGLLLWFMGLATLSATIRFFGLPSQLIGAGMLTLGFGVVGIGTSAIFVSRADSVNETPMTEITDVRDEFSSELGDDVTDDYEDDIGDILDDLFGDSDDDDTLESSSSIDDNPSSSFIEAPIIESVPEAAEEIDLDDKVNNIRENQYLTRELLFNTFKPFLGCNTPTFADRTEIYPDSEDFETLASIALKALSNVAKCDLKDLRSKLVSAYETYFSYELRLERIRGIKNTDDIAREMEVYFRKDSRDTSVSATVDIEQDYYKVVITKGESAVVTFGDIFRHQKNCDYFLDTSHALPMITGITELGDVILDDAKVFDSMLIAGKPRSGKSWYVFSTLMSWAMYNTPDDVLFIVVDPKGAYMFKAFAMLPHVVGLHDGKNILDIMDELINKEGPRRKRLLENHKVDDIWALRKKGVKLPVLYLVIDEYITVKNDLGQLSKDLDIKLQTILSQLPSLGVRVLMVPHRAVGVLDKTNRSLVNFYCSIKGELEDIKDTLGITKWTRHLTKPGDIALKASTNPEPIYIRGPALATSDGQMAELIKAIAKAFYKMGVDIPKNDILKVCSNRDEDYIRSELYPDNNLVQYSSMNKMLNSDDEYDSSVNKNNRLDKTYIGDTGARQSLSEIDSNEQARMRPHSFENRLNDPNFIIPDNDKSRNNQSTSKINIPGSNMSFMDLDDNNQNQVEDTSLGFNFNFGNNVGLTGVESGEYELDDFNW